MGRSGGGAVRAPRPGRLWAGGGTSTTSQATWSPEAPDGGDASLSSPWQEKTSSGGDRLGSGKDTRGSGAGRRGPAPSPLAQARRRRSQVPGSTGAWAAEPLGLGQRLLNISSKHPSPAG